MSGGRNRLVPVVVGLLAAASAFWLQTKVLPFPGHYRHSLLPFEAAGALGILSGLAVAARTSPRATQLLRSLGLSFGIAAALILGIWLGDGHFNAGRARPLLRNHFSGWIPVVSTGALVLWITAFFAERKAKRRLPVFTAVIFGLALATVSLQVGKYQYDAFAGERVRAWNVFHYYVGSKYFSELSYFDLYAATLAADDDFTERREARGKRPHDRWSKIVKARDQRDYRVKARETITAEFDRGIISPERLKELGADSRFIGQYMGFRNPGWHQAFRDLGYNPAPAWTVVGTPVSSLVPAKWPYFWLIVNSDVPLYVAAFLLLWWAFGLRIVSMMAIWLCSAQLNEARFTGGFLQYDWMCTTLAAVALYHRGWHKSSGVVLSWAAMTRAFPGVLVFGLGLQAGLALLGVLRRARTQGPGLAHKGPLARIPKAQWNFLLAFTLACGTLFGASHLTGRGGETWLEWADKIGRHSELHAVTSNMRIGLGRLVIHQPRAKRFWAEARGSKQEKLAQGADRMKVYKVIGLLLLLAAIVRRRDTDAIVLMLFLPFLLWVVSRYYASVWVLLFVLGASPRGSPDHGRTSWMALIAGGVLLLLNASFYGWGFVTDGKATTTAYFVINYAMYTLFCGICVAYIVGDVRGWLRSRRGAQGGGEDAPVALRPESGSASGLAAGSAEA